MRLRTWIGGFAALALLVAAPALAFVMDGPPVGSLRQVMANDFEAYNLAVTTTP